jgi:hypothetical protein
VTSSAREPIFGLARSYLLKAAVVRNVMSVDGMRAMRPLPTLIALAAVLVLASASAADAAKRKKPRATTSDYPYSIMTDERGTRPARAYQPWLPPPHTSPLTPQGQAPNVPPVRPLGQAGSPPMIAAPGVSGTTGPAIAPARPPGQSFQDRTVNCVQSGGAAGVGAGQIGAYTRGCVN